MAIEIRMPQWTGAPGAARVERWFREEGEDVREGEELLALAGENVAIRLPSPVSGVVKEILVDEGDAVKAGDVLALVDLANARV